MTNSNTLLVGGGITSSLTAYCLRNHKHIIIDLWEKEEEIGGRMKTLHSEHTPVAVDVGAQYITSSETMMHQNENIYNSLLGNDKLRLLTSRIDNLRPLPGGIFNYVAPAGMSSLVKHFTDSAKLHSVRTSHTIKSLNIVGDNVEVETDTGIKELFKAVVLTMPVPCVLDLSGDFKHKVNEEMSEDLKKVKYSSRFVLILIYRRVLNVEWAANYLPKDEIFRYVAIQERKVSVDVGTSSVIFHTSVEFGEKFRHSEDAKPILLERVRQLFPQWRDPVDEFCYKWQYSQVVAPFRSTPGLVVLSTKPVIILAGDGFTRSNFDGCIESAKLTAETLLKLL